MKLLQQKRCLKFSVFVQAVVCFVFVCLHLLQISDSSFLHFDSHRSSVAKKILSFDIISSVKIPSIEEIHEHHALADSGIRSCEKNPIITAQERRERKVEGGGKSQHPKVANYDVVYEHVSD